MARTPKSQNPAAELSAIAASHAVAEFSPDGIILSANENFLNALGYRLEEIEGRHHSILVEPKHRNSPEYRAFWNKMKEGQFESGDYKRIGRDGQEVWFQASYNPVLDTAGNPIKIVKLATDITEKKRAADEQLGQAEAVNKSHAVAEFTLDGTLITANKKFLDVVGYTLSEVEGRHHSMFVEPGLERSPSYQLFWARLRKGQFQNGAYMRVGNGGKKIWFQASYNPIMDNKGKPVKIVKIATDITERKIAADENLGTIDALQSVAGIADFGLDGTILDANDKFLAMLGYTLPEVQGKPHSMLVPPEERNAPAYRQFWASLIAGKHITAEYRRLSKDGDDVWLRASYTPILDITGKPVRIIKFATDITAEKTYALDQSQQLQAISKSQAVIELGLDGTILNANDRFLALFGYALAEIQGRHHLIFVPPEERGSESYRQFWQRLRTGQYQTAEYKRIGKAGREIWLQATYNPILDVAGNPVRIVKVATDVTAQKQTTAEFLSQIAAIHRTEAVIEFTLDGTILTANENFCKLMGYRLEDIKGRPHGMLLDPADRSSPEFTTFWERLRAGEHISGEFRRLTADGREVWIQASYNTIQDSEGKPVRIVNFATDITAQKQKTAEYLSQIATIHRSQGVLEMALDGTILNANANCLKFMGCTLDEIRGKSHAILVPPEERNSPEFAALWDRLRAGELVAGEFRRQSLDGREVWLQVCYDTIQDSSGKPARIVAFATDITAQHSAAVEHLAQIAAIHRTHAFVEYKPDGTILTANENFLAISGYSLAELQGASAAMLLPPDEAEAQAYRTLWSNLNQGHPEAGEFRRVSKTGREYWIRGSFTPVLDSQGRPTKIIAFGMDITKEKLATAAAEQDALTGLPNRILMTDRITQAITLARRHHTRLALLFLDLDGFKKINDSFGHAVGDKLLQSIAARLTDALRRSDTVSRHGGDEFLVLLPELRAPEDAALISNNLLAEIAKPYTIDGHDVNLTTSIGIALYPEDAADPDALIKNADIAMYQAKEAHRNAYQFFRPSMNARAHARRAIEINLRKAIDREEFSLAYQPKINIQTGEIIGAEALIRWTNPELGNVPPARFIPVAEDCGLMTPIGAWVLRAACRQAQAWIDAGAPPMRLAVNISAMQFANLGFPEMVETILDETRLAPQSLELEVSEKDLMKSPDLAINVLQHLRDAGVMIAVDDFGTGVSSLSFLCRLPIRSLKIDESFIRDHAPHENAPRIVKSVIAMAHRLNWQVVAEGVETQEELDFLRANDCDEAQGNYFGRAQPAEQFAALRATGIFGGNLNLSLPNASLTNITTTKEWPRP